MSMGTTPLSPTRAFAYLLKGWHSPAGFWSFMAVAATPATTTTAAQPKRETDEEDLGRRARRGAGLCVSPRASPNMN